MPWITLPDSGQQPSLLARDSRSTRVRSGVLRVQQLDADAHEEHVHGESALDEGSLEFASVDKLQVQYGAGTLAWPKSTLTR